MNTARRVIRAKNSGAILLSVAVAILISCDSGQLFHLLVSGPSADAVEQAADAMNDQNGNAAAPEEEIQQPPPPIAGPPSESLPAPAPQIDAPPAAAPPQAQGAHAPTILNIDIAREIPANGTKVGGTIIFEDAGQDVTLLRADVLAATLHAESWTYDPRQNMVWSGNRGIAAFQVWCTGDPQDVSYSFTLQDSAGSLSPPWRLDYTCK